MSKVNSVESVVMVGAAIPDDLMNVVIKADPVPQIQTQKLSWAVIHGIESAGICVDIISTVAISDFPKSSFWGCLYRNWNRSNGSTNQIAPFLNLLGFKQVSRFFSSLFLLVKWILKNNGKNKYIVLYGLIVSHLYAALIVKLFFSAKVVVIITDLPGQVTSKEFWLKRILRPIDRNSIYFALRRLDGCIVLTREIATDIVPNLPALVVEGIVSAESESLGRAMVCKKRSNADFIVLYAGGLESNYGVSLLLEAFSILPDADFQLWLFGAGRMVEQIQKQAQCDSRIKYFGIVAPAEVFRYSQMATVLINPRPSTEEFVKYSFPSKLLEYMAVGRPVVSTRLPGIPSDYIPYVIWLDQETPEALSALFLQLRKRPSAELDFVGIEAKSHVLKYKTYKPQGRRIVDFLAHI